MRVVVEVNVDNAAFEDDPGEIVRVIHKGGDHAYQMLQGGTVDEVPLRDVNGNTVGAVRLLP